MGKRKQNEGREDQYGSVGGSQDHDSYSSFGKGRGGGGDAGGGRGGGRAGGNAVTFQRHVPKFLQGFEHMLGKGAHAEVDPEAEALKHHQQQQRQQEEDAEDDDNEELEALKIALELNPDLSKIHPELESIAQKAEASKLKEQGNKAFSSNEFEKAIECFTKCIELDPRNETYFSNRSAAYASLKQYSKAADDAREAIRIKPTWAKAHSRLGAALFGAELYSESREAYEAAVKLEPDNKQTMAALDKARMFEVRAEAEGRHKFKKAKSESGGGSSSRNSIPHEKVAVKGPAVKNKTLLSFDEENEEEEDE